MKTHIGHTCFKGEGQASGFTIFSKSDSSNVSAGVIQGGRSEMFVGDDGATMRLGAGMSIRTLDSDSYDETRKARRHLGPFMPVILLACSANELAQEYIHGSVPYGAFSYVMAKVLREQGKSRARQLTFQTLIERVQEDMNEVGVTQTQSVSGPARILTNQVPLRRVT